MVRGNQVVNIRGFGYNVFAHNFYRFQMVNFASFEPFLLLNLIVLARIYLQKPYFRRYREVADRQVYHLNLNLFYNYY